MKYILTALVVSAMMVSFSFGQIAYKKGDQTLSATLGIGSLVYETNATSTVPPLTLAYDYGYNENISLGGLVSYTASKYEWNDSYLGNEYGYKWTWSYFVIAARGSYHYDLFHSSNVDTYGGLILGYDIASSSSEYTGDWGGYYGGEPSAASSGGLIFGGYVGARYFFTPKFAAQAELGFGLAVLNIGVAYKL
jgi:hypothetical protein